MGDGLSLRGAIRDTSDPMRVMRRVVEAALHLIAGAEGSVVELVDGDALSYVCCAGTLAGAVGTRLRADASLSGLAVRTGSTLRCDDSETDARVDRDACRRVGAISMVCVPLRHQDRPVGVLKVSASSPGAFDDADVATLTGLAEFVTAMVTATSELSRVTDKLLSAADGDPGRGHAPDASRMSAFVANVLRPGIVGDVEAAQRVERVLAAGELAVVYQPVVGLHARELVGVEALARFLAVPYRPPDAWFAEAHRVGLGVELEIAAVREALSHADQLPPGCFVAVNVGPQAIASAGMLEALASIDPRRVVVELTEHLQVDDYPGLRRALVPIRGQGARLAVDDTGAGFASLSHVVKLAPDIIKLDIDLTRGIDLDPARRSLTAAIVAFAADTGAEVIAEGIETDGELRTLRQLDVGYGQGYLLGRPGPPEMLDARRGRAGGPPVTG